MSTIINKVTGYNALDFAREFLFDPLGISNVLWGADPQDINSRVDGLHLTPRDMAKFGFLYLNKGLWEGEQIVPASV